jgi:hypothetical protein
LCFSFVVVLVLQDKGITVRPAAGGVLATTKGGFTTFLQPLKQNAFKKKLSLFISIFEPYDSKADQSPKNTGTESQRYLYDHARHPDA